MDPKKDVIWFLLGDSFLRRKNLSYIFRKIVFLEEHILGVNEVTPQFQNGLKYFLSVSLLAVCSLFFTITIFAKHQNMKRALSLYCNEKMKNISPFGQTVYDRIFGIGKRW
jgi:hypothetical protein